jgi:hypothetical protein
MCIKRQRISSIPSLPVIIEGDPVLRMKSIFVSLAASAVLFGSLAVAEQQSAQPQQPPEIVQFQKLEDQWSDAVAKRDQYALELLMSPVLVNISATGEVTTRNQQIAQLYEKGGPQLASMEQRVVNVRTFEDTAVVDGTYIIKWKINGQVQEERGIFTHVFQHARGSWVCVHAQRTAVVEKVDQKQKTASKKSNAELPFHIPLIHEGAQSKQPPPAPGADPPSP